MSVRIEFHGGPADGTVREYPHLDTALPSLYWSSDGPEHRSAIYHRADDTPDPTRRTWTYNFAAP